MLTFPAEGAKVTTGDAKLHQSWSRTSARGCCPSLQPAWSPGPSLGRPPACPWQSRGWGDPQGVCLGVHLQKHGEHVRGHCSRSPRKGKPPTFQSLPLELGGHIMNHGDHGEEQAGLGHFESPRPVPALGLRLQLLTPGQGP